MTKADLVALLNKHIAGPGERVRLNALLDARKAREDEYARHTASVEG